MATERPQVPAPTARRNRSPPEVWAVEADAADCPHPTERLRAVGDDGRNAYARCARCGSVLVARLPVGRSMAGQKVD